MTSAVEVRVEDTRLPTYDHGPVDPNPLFLEERVYQGSSGRVYPYGVVNTVSSQRGERVYRAVIIENAFLEIMVLPELGGRVHRAYDKIREARFRLLQQRHQAGARRPRRSLDLRRARVQLAAASPSDDLHAGR